MAGYWKCQLKPQIDCPSFLPVSSFSLSVLCLNSVYLLICLCYCYLLLILFSYAEEGFALLLVHDVCVDPILSIDTRRITQHHSPATHHCSDPWSALAHCICSTCVFIRIWDANMASRLYAIKVFSSVLCLSRCIVFLGFLHCERLHGSKINST